MILQVKDEEWNQFVEIRDTERIENKAILKVIVEV